MPSRFPPNLLERSAAEASRLLALSYLDQIDSARDRLDDALDHEALHDFRVGIRRLRSAVRAYRAELEGSVGGKMRRRLRNLASATNEGRDLEVQLAWLGTQRGALGEDDVAGFYWLVGRLEDRKQRTHDRAVADVIRRYDKAAVKLRRALGVLRIELQTGTSQRLPTLREVTGVLARRQVAELRDDLAGIRDAGDAEQAHRARISLKRLRYLLEPVARRNRRAGTLVRRFKEAQDLLGEHHDMHLLSAAVASFRDGLSGSKFSGAEPGLVTLSRLAEDAAVAAFHRFQSIWGSEPGNPILARVEELGQWLEQEPVPVEPALRAPAAEEAPLPEAAETPESLRAGESLRAAESLRGDESLRGGKASVAIPLLTLGAGGNPAVDV